MRIVFFLLFVVISNIFASFNLENQFNNLGSSSIKTESLKQNFLSEPLESLINPDEYTLGPGDGIYLNIVTANQIVNLNLFISPIGDILIPVVGTVFVNGLTINEGFSAIRDKCLDKYNDSNISITLSKIKDFKIQVLGPFKESGVYISNPVSRVSDVYEQILRFNNEASISDSSILSLKKILSRRNIILERDSRTYPVDILKFSITGEEELNPFLQSGDKIFFDLLDKNITITGGVKAPGVYEYVEGETVSSMIELAGGFTYDAIDQQIEISRFIDTDLRSEMISKENFNTMILNAQDLINVKVKNNYKKHKLVEIKGEVLNPGFYSVEEGKTTVRDIIDKAGGYSSLADRNKISIMNSTSFDEKSDLDNESTFLYRKEFHDYIHKSYEINELNQLIPINAYGEMQVKKILDYNVYDGYFIEIPKNFPFIEISGAIKYPGLYPFSKDKSLNQYLRDAGGITESETNDIYIIKRGSGQRINYKNIDKLDSGDIIYIVQKINLDKNTKLENSIMIANGITSTLSFIISLIVLLGGFN